MTLEELTADEQRLLRQFSSDFQVPADAAARLSQRLAAAGVLAAPLPAAPPPPSIATHAVSAGWAAKPVAALAAAALAAGGAAGFWVGRRSAPPAPPPPVAAAAPAPAPAEVAEGASPLPAPSAAREQPLPAHKERPEPADPQLTREHQLLESARSALLHGSVESAISWLATHAVEFPQGRLEEEREALWIQALRARASFAQADEKLRRFNEKFPKSLLGAELNAGAGTRRP